MNDQELIRGCLENKKEFQKELFLRFSGRMLTVCRRYARHRLEAEDMLQDAFVNVFRKLHTFEGRGSFEGWIKRIVINTAIKACQKKSHSNELTGLERLPDIRYEKGEHGAALSHEFLMSLVAQLPDGYRLVFNLNAIEGYSHDEIANLLGIEAATSRSQLVKARRMLQRMLLKVDQTIVNSYE